MRTSDCQHRWVHGADFVGIFAQTASDDDFTVFIDGFANGIERLLDGRLNKTTGIDHDQIRTVIIFGDLVAFTSQLGDDAFAIHEGLRTA